MTGSTVFTYSQCSYALRHKDFHNPCEVTLDSIISETNFNLCQTNSSGFVLSFIYSLHKWETFTMLTPTHFETLAEKKEPNQSLLFLFFEISGTLNNKGVTLWADTRRTAVQVPLIRADILTWEIAGPTHSLPVFDRVSKVSARNLRGPSRH